MRDCAPVALFVYNRPGHTRRTVEALRRNLLAHDTDLFIFCDAAKSPQAEDQVQAVRDYVKTVEGFRSIKIVARAHNFGLSASILDGVTQVCGKYGRIIVLEDDLVTGPFFLAYMNDALDLYADDDRVIAVHGYMFPVGAVLPETFFLRDPGCWGWATWKRGWDLFDADGASHLAAIRRQKREKEFDLDGSFNYLDMLERRIAGRNQSWAILWYATAFLRGKLTLYPGLSLVQNIGYDGSGTHRGDVDSFLTALSETRVMVRPIPRTEDRAVRAMLVAYLAALKEPRSLLARIIGRLRRSGRF